MSDEYLEPINVMEEAFAEVHKDVKADACRIALQKKRRDREVRYSMRICVGGGWRYGASSLRAADRNYSTPSYQSNFNGGRLARSPDPSEPLTK